LIGLRNEMAWSTSEDTTVLVSTYSKQRVLWMAAYLTHTFPIINN
jgi:hypothetical protein